MLHPNPHRAHTIQQAILGQCIGDSLGNYCIKQNIAADILWNKYAQTQALPYKKAVFSVYTKHMCSILDIWKETANNIPLFVQRVSTQIKQDNSHTLLCRALQNQQAFHTPDIEMSIHMGPLATCIDDASTMLSTVYALTILGNTHPQSIAASLMYAAFCWNLAQEKQLSQEEIFQTILTWQQTSNTPHITGEMIWNFQQAIYIANQYTIADMLEFTASVNSSSEITMPSTQNSLGLLPILLTQEPEFSFSSVVSWGGDLALLLGLKGCLLGLQHPTPTWLTESVTNHKSLHKYWVTQPESSQLSLFGDL